MTFKRLTLRLATAGVLLTTPVVAGAADSSHTPALNVSDRHRNCFFDLHPELTRAEFREFTDELGSILRPRQLSDASTLGRGRFEVGLAFARTGIDDRKGAWNNTMSHPTADHELGDAIALPLVRARMGVSDRVDLGVTGGADPRSNYGVAGVEAKIALLRQGPGRPVSVAIRPTVSALIGPSEVFVGNASLDLSVSRRMGAWAPYVGGSSLASLGVERSKDVDLKDEALTRSVVFGGVAFEHRGLSVAAEAEHGKLTSVSLRVSARF